MENDAQQFKDEYSSGNSAGEQGAGVGYGDGAEESEGVQKNVAGKNLGKTSDEDEMDYAGFWQRFAAAVMDGVILNVSGVVVGLAVGFEYSWIAAGESVGATSYALTILVPWAYFALMESSKYQATLGKKAIGIKVTDMEGGRINFQKATVRHWSKIISTLLLFTGFIMIAFTEKKQGLHDKIAKCLVLDE